MRSLIDIRHVGVAARLAVAAIMLSGLVACVQPLPAGVAVPTQIVPDRIVVLTVFFNFDSHALRPESSALLDNLVQALNDQRLTGYHFDINGHTDITGRLGYNIALSTLRAGAVADYLAARGVPRELMQIQGFGPLQLMDTANPSSPTNRRVEIVSTR